ncbi:MAG: internalization-related competence protein ComEC/Rec2 [Myxococcales bacterium]|nr:internalization-related competence protein ComEC/Rec2 [Myxococcales bacterium]
MISALALVAVCFSVGIAVGEWVGVTPAAAALLGGALVLAALLARHRRRSIGLAALGLAVAVGIVAAAGARPRPAPELFDGERWVLEGDVVATPQRLGAGVRVAIDLTGVERGGQRSAARDRVMLFLDGEPVEPLLPGDRVRVPARLHRPRGFVNPDAPDAARRAAAEGVAAVASVRAASLSRLVVAPRLGIARAIAAWRARMLASVQARLTGDGRALVESLVLGDRGDVRRPLDDAFRSAGVSHVLSVSGLHLAIAAFLFYVGLRRLLACVPALAQSGSVQRWAATVALPAIAAYTMVTGAEVATVRSCVVAFVWLGAVAVRRRATAAQALAVAALAILCASPLELFDPSFQLSFAAAGGTSLLAHRWSPRGSGGSIAARLVRWTARLCAASAAAILATAPIGAWHFAQFAPAGVLSNIVVVPVAELGVVPVGLAGCVGASLHLPGSGLLLDVAGWLSEAMARFVVWFAAVAPAWRVPAPNLVEIVVWYAALAAVAALGWRGRRIALSCALLFVVAVGWRLLSRAHSQTVRATFLDVGQGDACVVELPHGRVMVVDGGGSFDPKFDPGQQVIAPFLWRRGIRHIDLMVLSHPHPDHANGLPFLVESFSVGELWTNGQETAQPGTVALLAAAQRRGVVLGVPRPLELGGARLEPLAPLDDTGRLDVDPARGENDNSLVVALGWRGRRILFAGDLEAEGEAALIASANATAADVVKVPHHGSKTSSTAAFIAATHPALAVISVGEHNRWGFPNAGVTLRWRDAGARVLRTDRDGGVTVTIDSGGRVAGEGSAVR